MEVTTLNFYVNNLGASQLSYSMLKNIKRRIDEHNDIAPIVFYENLERPPIPPNFALMQIAEGWGQHGIGIATSLSTLVKMKSFPALSKRIFYVWDLEWLRMQPRRYDVYNKFYLDRDITLIARCESHSDLITNCFNRVPDAIIPDFSVDSLLEFVNKEKQDVER